MDWRAIQWGTVGEWVSGIGALAAVGAAFVVQHRSHRREDRRVENLRLEHALSRAVETIDFRVVYDIRDDDVWVPDEVEPDDVYVLAQVTNSGRTPYFDVNCHLVDEGFDAHVTAEHVAPTPNAAAAPTITGTTWCRVPDDYRAMILLADRHHGERPKPSLSATFRDEDGVRFRRDASGRTTLDV